MKWPMNFTPKKGVVGIEMLSKGMAMIARGEDGIVSAMHVFDAELAEGESREEALTRFVQGNDLSAETCNLVLGRDQYQLLLVEAPDVPDEEIREAMRWRIKDLISMPLESAVIDLFFLPGDGAKGGKRMVYVVVVEKQKLQGCIELVKDSGLNLHAIDIGELALRNVALLKEEGKAGTRGLAIARINKGSGNVSLYRDGNLYLSRSFQMNYGGGLLDDLPADNLMLEIQRSLDYYERQMGQRPPAALYIFGDNVTEDKLTEEILRGLPLSVKYLDLSAELAVNDDVQQELLPLCMGALGATYRGQLLI